MWAAAVDTQHTLCTLQWDDHADADDNADDDADADDDTDSIVIFDINAKKQDNNIMKLSTKKMAKHVNVNLCLILFKPNQMQTLLQKCTRPKILYGSIKTDTKKIILPITLIQKM